jgi:palmitoyltransferase
MHWWYLAAPSRANSFCKINRMSDESDDAIPQKKSTKALELLGVELNPPPKRPINHVPMSLPSKALASLGSTVETITLHHAAQRGEVDTVTRLLDEGLYQATDRDFQNVTALHWASINNRIEVVRLLIVRGADPNAQGGDLMATPLHWACRKGHVAAASVLMDKGADPTILDAQGFNALHLAVHSSNPFLVLYFVVAPEPALSLDMVDTLGHTALMWAAYQGDNVTVDILLQQGANVHLQDQSGFTCVHWAVSKGNTDCAIKLIRAGVDLSVREGKGRTARELALELGMGRVWEQAIKQVGYMGKGDGLVNEMSAQYLVYMLPFLMLGLSLYVMGLFPWFTGVPMGFAVFTANHLLVVRYLLPRSLNGKNKSPTEALHRSPYLSAIFQSTVLYAFLTWGMQLLWATGDLLLPHLMFGVLGVYGLSHYVKCVMEDPGFIQKPGTRQERGNVMKRLISMDLLDAKHYCITCLVSLKDCG